MRTILERGLQETAEWWPAIQTAYRWIHQAAHLLKNDDDLNGRAVRRRLRRLLGAMARHRAKAGRLASAIGHFLKVMRSYWPGLFHTYDAPDLPRTNNDLEHLFGSHRYHERRATGRKVASPALVLRGSVRLIASTATRLQTFTARDLAPRSLDAWLDLQKQLDKRRHYRVLRCRFRRAPDAYLQDLEARLLQRVLPP